MGSSRGLRSALAVVLLCVLCAAECPAQAQSDQDLMSMKIEELTQIKVYSASRRLEEVQQAPAAVTIVTREEIRRYGWRNLGEVLRSLRGFYTSYDRQRSYLGVRGFLRPGDYNSRILVLMNGHRLNDNVYHSAPVGNEIPLELDLIDHIEIVRGPGSSLFGTNAVFGVVNIITRRPAADSAFEASGEVSSFVGRSGRLTVIDHYGKLSALVSGTMSLDPGQSRLFFPEFAAPETNHGIAENMDGLHSDSVLGDLQVGEFRLQGWYGNTRKRFPTASFGSIFNDPEDAYENQRGYLDARFHRNLSANTGLDARIFYDEYKYILSAGFNPADRIIMTANARADWVGGEINLDHQMGKHSLTLGLDYEYSPRIEQSTGMRGQGVYLYYSSNTSWLSAAYGELSLRPFSKLTLNAGGRLDWFSTFGEAFSPRLALIYSPTHKSSLKYIFGTAFRAPNAYEEYFFNNISIAQAPHRLKPEQILSHEVVVEHKLKPWFSATAGGYYTELKRLIDQVLDPSTGKTYFVNESRVHVKGLEFELDAKHTSGVLGRASYEISQTYNHQLNRSLDTSPRSQAKFTVSSPLSRRAVGGLELLYVSAMQNYRGTRVPPFALMNATLSTGELWRSWQFSASCYNTLDRRWFRSMSPTDPEAMIQQDGRTFRFKVTYRLPFRDAPVRP